MEKTAKTKIFTIIYLLAITAALFPASSSAAGIGEACAIDADCPEAFCSAGDRVCLPKHEQGGECDRSAMCQTGFECRGGTCQTPAAAQPVQPSAQAPEEGGGGYQGINLNAPLPGLTRVNNLGEYISGIYRYSIGIAAILAGIMITVGGLRWLTAAGNASSIDSAKKTIGGAVIGLILVMSSYVILNTINPELIKLRVPAITQVARSPLSIQEVIVDAGGYRDRTSCENDPRRVCPGGGCRWDQERQVCTTIAGGGGQGEVGGVCGPSMNPPRPEPSAENITVGCTNGTYCVRGTAGGGGIGWVCTRGTSGDTCEDDEDCVGYLNGVTCEDRRCLGPTGRTLAQRCSLNQQCGSGFCGQLEAAIPARSLLGVFIPVIGVAVSEVFLAEEGDTQQGRCLYGDKRQTCLDSSFCRRGYTCARCADAAHTDTGKRCTQNDATPCQGDP